MSAILGLGLTLLAAILLLALTFVRRKSPGLFREIAALASLRRAAGLTVEDGTRLHVSLGRGDLLAPRGGAASLSGLALLRVLAERTSISDRPPIATSGNAAFALLSQDTLQAGYRAAGVSEAFPPESGRLGGLTPFSYAAGAMDVIRHEQISANALVGDFGPESALLADAAERENALLVGAASDPSAQAVLFASVADPLVGEELFAAPAYLGQDPAHHASLQTQDILRWLVILALLVIAGLKLVGLP